MQFIVVEMDTSSKDIDTPTSNPRQSCLYYEINPHAGLVGCRLSCEDFVVTSYTHLSGHFVSWTKKKTQMNKKRKEEKTKHRFDTATPLKSKVGDIFGTLHVCVYVAIAITLQKAWTATKNADSSLCSDHILYLAITFTDPVLLSNCSRPFSPGCLSSTAWLLNC